MVVTDVLLVIGFVTIGLSMWFSFKQKETSNDEGEKQKDNEKALDGYNKITR